MIEICKTVISLIATELAITIIRKDQGGAKPASPFAAYKLMSINRSNYAKKEIANPDPSKITNRFSNLLDLNVSLSFYSTTSVEEIFVLAETAIQFLQVGINDLLRSENLHVQLLGVSITDRTTYLDPIYEYQVGFDFIIKAKSSFDRVIPAVDLDATIEGAQLEIL